MNVLVIGSGGREHAICWKLAQSKRIGKLFCAPGNPGTGLIAENVPIRAADIEALAEFAEARAIDLTVVGPEDPLVAGIVDAFEARGLRIFGPSKAAARLEGSKQFAKEVMRAAGVPTAAYRSFECCEDALAYVRQQEGLLVVKADGLAAGKGVVVCRSAAEAEAALPELFTKFDSRSVVVEEFLEGREASFIVATDGERIVPFAASNDYKRAGDNDTGPNTGGMGTVSPTPHLHAAQEQWVVENVIRPTLTEMQRRGCPFRGFLYAGLMIAPSGRLHVLEFNARLGDPETQVILRRMEGDLLELLLSLTSQGRDPLPVMRGQDACAVCVVLAAEGYPEAPRAGDVITGVDAAQEIPGVVVFHAGTKLDEQRGLMTAGGRVLNVTATGDTIAAARSQAYRALAAIEYRGKKYRRDIAAE